MSEQSTVVRRSPRRLGKSTFPDADFHCAPKAGNYLQNGGGGRAFEKKGLESILRKVFSEMMVDRAREGQERKSLAQILPHIIKA